MAPHEKPADFILLLQLACSGELAASLAYRGHAASVPDPAVRERILGIEQEELDHRALVKQMLAELGAEPDPHRERRARWIGRSLGMLCHVSGWLAPMYGAGRLEGRNIREYETAARLAWACGRTEWIDCLLTMAEVEWEHERYFRDHVESHWSAGLLRVWPKPPPREQIRASFARDTAPGAPGGPFVAAPADR